LHFRQQLDHLDRGQCMDLLETVGTGRLLLFEDALPIVLPVTFRLCPGDVVICVAGDGQLAAAAINTVVAFEADEFDPGSGTGWSVIVVGHASHVTAQGEMVALTENRPQPVVDHRAHLIRLRGEKVTGSRLARRPLPRPRIHQGAQGCT
jgi:nitroimidazol reductase NimA-like FMN-containing flavoprotein (pyridoxamine 5'-phosphate oxidase superfamily)